MKNTAEYSYSDETLVHDLHLAGASHDKQVFEDTCQWEPVVKWCKSLVWQWPDPAPLPVMQPVLIKTYVWSKAAFLAFLVFHSHPSCSGGSSLAYGQPSAKNRIIFWLPPSPSQPVQQLTGQLPSCWEDLTGVLFHLCVSAGKASGTGSGS